MKRSLDPSHVAALDESIRTMRVTYRPRVRSTTTGFLEEVNGENTARVRHVRSPLSALAVFNACGGTDTIIVLLDARTFQNTNVRYTDLFFYGSSNFELLPQNLSFFFVLSVKTKSVD